MLPTTGPQTRRRGLQLPTMDRRPKGGVCATDHGPQTKGGVCSYQRRTADPRAGSAATNDGPQTRRRGLQLPTTNRRPEGGVCATNDGPQTRRRGLQLPTTDRRPKGGVCSYQRRTADPRAGSALHYYVGFIPYLESRRSSETFVTKLSVLFSLACERRADLVR